MGAGNPHRLGGLPILAVLPLLWRAGARLERILARAALGLDIPAPYRARPGGSLTARGRVLVADPATWKDLAYLVLLAPLGFVWSSVTFTVWATVLELVFVPLYYYALPAGDLFWFGWAHWLPLVAVSALPWAFLACVIGLVLTVPAAYLVRGMGVLHGTVAQALLGPSRTRVLAGQAAALRESRDRTVDAAAAERHRIERALHDGAQARLVSVAMTLGMARGKLSGESQTLRDLVETAHAEVKRAIAELRDLARGIHPAVLADRGLDAALSDLARRCPVPVEITVEPGERPPRLIEETAYFVAAEALTNIAKHAHANLACVTIGRFHKTLAIEVFDDGEGGALATPDGGLAGLADRVAGLGGTLTVASPSGGPTTIRAELPCGW